jgi:cysteine desulfurase
LHHSAPLPDQRLFYPATSRQEVIAIANGHPSSLTIEVDLDGCWKIPEAGRSDLLVWPSANNETGAIGVSPIDFNGQIFADCTTDPGIALPPQWTTALWDSKSWSGPSGLGIFAVRDASAWSNPLPHIDHRYVPGGFNSALAIASAVALEAHQEDYKVSLKKISQLNLSIRDFLSHNFDDVDIASPVIGLPHLLSFSFLYLDAERLVDRMERRGVSIDSGSACISANLEASHVLAAMGRLTHGNVRLHLYPGHTESDVEALLIALKEEVDLLRSNQ